MKQNWRSLFLGGILPLLLFAWIEEQFGTVWGLIAGMTLGLGEMGWELRKKGKVDFITLGGNGVLLLLGIISLLTQEGIWFKLQPTLLEASFSIFLWGSLIAKKPLLLLFLQKQGAIPKELSNSVQRGTRGFILLDSFRGITFRLGVFFAFHAVLATWAALYWTTAAWIALKGIGLTLSLVVYLVAESLVLRYRISKIP